MDFGLGLRGGGVGWWLLVGEDPFGGFEDGGATGGGEGFGGEFRREPHA